MARPATDSDSSDRAVPTFFILGAPKAGTTALYAMLRQHPDVYMPERKEPHFFAYRDHPLDFAGPGDERIMRHMVVRDEAAYHALYAGRSERALGDASVMQMVIEGTERRILDAVPDARFVCVLRDPVERAHSSWLHLVRDDREHLSFEAGLEAEPERIAAGFIPLWHYVNAGLYARQLTRWFSVFDRDRFLILTHDELRADPHAVLARTYAFLGVDAARPAVSVVERNVSGLPRNRALQRALTRPSPLKDRLKLLVPAALRESLVAFVKRRNVGTRPPLAAATAASLRSRFRDDVLELESLLGRDLASWHE